MNQSRFTLRLVLHVRDWICWRLVIAQAVWSRTPEPVRRLFRPLMRLTPGLRRATRQD